MTNKLSNLLAVVAAVAVLASSAAVAQESVFRREVKQGSAQTWVAKLKTRDALGQQMKGLPSVRMLAEQLPDTFEQQLDEAWELVKSGGTDYEVAAKVRADVFLAGRIVMPKAGDEAIAKYVSYIAGKMRVIGEKRPQSCRLFLKRSNEEDELVLALTHKELAQGMEVIDELFRSVDDKNAFRGRWEEASMMALQYIAQALPERERNILFNGADKDASDREVCDSVAKMYDTIGAMPLQERAVIMRLLNRKVS